MNIKKLNEELKRLTESKERLYLHLMYNGKEVDNWDISRFIGNVIPENYDNSKFTFEIEGTVRKQDVQKQNDKKLNIHTATPKEKELFITAHNLNDWQLPNMSDIVLKAAQGISANYTIFSYYDKVSKMFGFVFIDNKYHDGFGDEAKHNFKNVIEKIFKWYNEAGVNGFQTFLEQWPEVEQYIGTESSYV